MEVVYTYEDAPEILSKSIFLAGPTPRSLKTASWRPQALKILEELGYDGVVFVPEYRDRTVEAEYTDRLQWEWEEKHLNMADCILFWVPRNLTDMPAFTTNIEWGVWQNSGKAVFGAPNWAVNMNYQKYYADKLKVPLFSDLRETIKAALDMVKEGALRTGPERGVPLCVWRDPVFQKWYREIGSGNMLESIKVEWISRSLNQGLFAWVISIQTQVFGETAASRKLIAGGLLDKQFCCVSGRDYWVVIKDYLKAG